MSASCGNHGFYGGGKQFRRRTSAQIGAGRIGHGALACVGALEHEKPTSPDRPGSFGQSQFWTLLGVLYLLVPSVPPETSMGLKPRLPRNRHCPRAREQLTPPRCARGGTRQYNRNLLAAGGRVRVGGSISEGARESRQGGTRDHGVRIFCRVGVSGGRDSSQWYGCATIVLMILMVHMILMILMTPMVLMLSI